MKNISIFQIVFISVFGLFIMAGVVVMALYSQKGGSTKEPVSATIWGPLEWGVMEPIISAMRKNDKSLDITYVQKNSETLEYDIVEALATGYGPDLVILRQDSIIPSLTKILFHSYQSYPSREFQDTFMQEGEMLLAYDGIIGVPFSLDPLVMYWNRDIFSSGGVANPPKTWDEVFYLATKLTKRDPTTGDITQSAVALGEYSNIVNAKEIIASLLFQSGNTITSWNQQNTGADVVLLSQGSQSAVSAINFYTQFSNPTKSVYSWNRSLPDSKAMFLSGRLGIYFGFASEFQELKRKNPNLNFDVTYLPKLSGGVDATFGRMYSVFMLRAARNWEGAKYVARSLTSREPVAQYAEATYLPAPRRDIGVQAADPYKVVFMNSALISRAWLDPNRFASDDIFQEMIESITSGAADTGAAVGRAETSLKYYSP